MRSFSAGDGLETSSEVAAPESAFELDVAGPFLPRRCWVESWFWPSSGLVYPETLVVLHWIAGTITINAAVTAIAEPKLLDLIRLDTFPCSRKKVLHPPEHPWEPLTPG